MEEQSTGESPEILPSIPNNRTKALELVRETLEAAGIVNIEEVMKYISSNLPNPGEPPRSDYPDIQLH